MASKDIHNIPIPGTPVMVQAIELPRRIKMKCLKDRSFVTFNGYLIHTCSVPKMHPLYTDSKHCGACHFERHPS